MSPERFETLDRAAAGSWPIPALATALGRGLLGRCPVCGKGRVFRGFLKVATVCAACSTPLGLARADDAPPWFTILIVGHIVIPLIVLVDRGQQPPLWAMWAIFPALTLVLAVGLLRPVKGATVGLMLALNILKSGEPNAV